MSLGGLVDMAADVAVGWLAAVPAVFTAVACRAAGVDLAVRLRTCHSARPGRTNALPGELDPDFHHASSSSIGPLYLRSVRNLLTRTGCAGTDRS